MSEIVRDLTRYRKWKYPLPQHRSTFHNLIR